MHVLLPRSPSLHASRPLDARPAARAPVRRCLGCHCERISLPERRIEDEALTLQKCLTAVTRPHIDRCAHPTAQSRTRPPTIPPAQFAIATASQLLAASASCRRAAPRAPSPPFRRASAHAQRRLSSSADALTLRACGATRFAVRGRVPQAYTPSSRWPPCPPDGLAAGHRAGIARLTGRAARQCPATDRCPARTQLGERAERPMASPAALRYHRPAHAASWGVMQIVASMRRRGGADERSPSSLQARPVRTYACITAHDDARTCEHCQQWRPSVRARRSLAWVAPQSRPRRHDARHPSAHAPRRSRASQGPPIATRRRASPVLRAHLERAWPWPVRRCLRRHKDPPGTISVFLRRFETPRPRAGHLVFASGLDACATRA